VSAARTGGAAGPVLLVVGPAQHGVTAAALAQAGVDLPPGRPRVVRRDRVVGPDAVADLAADLGGGTVHAHVTDRLFGRTPEEAATCVVALARTCTLVVTLHDLPQPSDGAVNHPRRARAYAAVARAAAAVVVSSEHERRLLRAGLRDTSGGGSENTTGDVAEVDARVTVVPLPVPATLAPPGPTGARDVDPEVAQDAAVLGFLYPGKGHDAVLEALTGLPATVGLRALGRASDGHEDLVGRLGARAAELGRRFTVTGYVPDADLPRLLRSVLVPVAPHEHLSASGSINTWIGAGRRPLVPDSDYARELLVANPGAVQLYDHLPTAVARAVADPASTWLPAGFRGRPTLLDTVRAVRAVLAGVDAGVDAGAGAGSDAGAGAGVRS